MNKLIFSFFWGLLLVSCVSKTLPKDVSLTRTSLILTGKQIQIEKYHQLKILDFGKNTQLSPEDILAQIVHPEKLEVLILDSLNLKALPKNLNNFKNLQQLSLAYNPQLNLGDCFDILKNNQLRFLNLKGNQLKKLPANLTKLQSLQDVNLAYNLLQAPENYLLLGQLTNLKELWLDNNELKTLPSTIGALSQLKRLYIDGNQLSQLPDEMEGMGNLKVLHASFNNFKSFPTVFTKTPALILVHLNNNQIEYFPREYETKKYSIKGLILDNNPLPTTEINWAKKEFRHFFLLSFEQKK